MLKKIIHNWTIDWHPWFNPKLVYNFTQWYRVGNHYEDLYNGSIEHCHPDCCGKRTPLLWGLIVFNRKLIGRYINYF